MHVNLSGIDILVTGASRGIGKGIAEGLGAAGARVAVHYNQNKEAADELVNRIGHHSKSFQADLEIAEESTRLFQDVIDSFGHLDVLVNNA